MNPTDTESPRAGSAAVTVTLVPELGSQAAEELQLLLRKRLRTLSLVFAVLIGAFTLVTGLPGAPSRRRRARGCVDGAGGHGPEESEADPGRLDYRHPHLHVARAGRRPAECGRPKRYLQSRGRCVLSADRVSLRFSETRSCGCWPPTSPSRSCLRTTCDRISRPTCRQSCAASRRIPRCGFQTRPRCNWRCRHAQVPMSGTAISFFECVRQKPGLTIAPAPDAANGTQRSRRRPIPDLPDRLAPRGYTAAAVSFSRVRGKESHGIPDFPDGRARSNDVEQGKMWRHGGPRSTQCPWRPHHSLYLSVLVSVDWTRKAGYGLPPISPFHSTLLNWAVGTWSASEKLKPAVTLSQ